MKKLLLIAVPTVLVLTAGAFLALHLWRARVEANHEQRAFIRAEALFSQGRLIETAAIVHTFGSKPSARLDWRNLDFRVLVAQANIPRLIGIFHHTPDRILTHEAASLTVARAFLHQRDTNRLERILTAWNKRDRDEPRWRLLEADRLLLAGRPTDAELLLATTDPAHPPQSHDAPRLLRLAALAAHRNPREALTLLDQAATAAPHRPDTRSFRAQIFESLHHPAEARAEYTAAVAADPANPLWRDQLAEFHRRQGHLDLALRTWTESLQGTTFDAIWLKAAFWNRMLGGLPAGTAPIPRRTPTGPLGPLASLVRDLPETRFFDPDAFSALHDQARFTNERHEVFWLRLAECLRLGRESEAADILAGPRPPGASWEPRLERALAQILARRLPRTSTPARAVPTAPPITPDTHSFFRALEARPRNPSQAAPDPDPETPESFITGPHAFAGAFLAAGWREAALRLAGDSPVSESNPVWFIYGFAQALRFNRGPDTALAFLAAHPAAPALELLTAEIEIGRGNLQAGRPTLERLATNPSPVGLRATWLLAVEALDLGQTRDARRLVEAHPTLASQPAGRDLIALTLAREGEVDAASRP
jgi:hypothetical protein